MFPIGSALRDEDEKYWLKDRSDGLFSRFPKDHVLVSFFMFVLLGCITDVAPRALTEDSTVSLQLAHTSFASGGALELGRMFQVKNVLLENV